MTRNEPSSAIRVVVDAPIECAFKVFTEGFGNFKPREHNLLPVPIAATIFEPCVGGHVYDRGIDPSERRWSRVLAYEPPKRLVFSWDISARWQVETDLEKTRCASLPRRRRPRRRRAAVPAALRRAVLMPATVATIDSGPPKRFGSITPSGA